MSLIPHFSASRLGNYVIGVLVAWILLFAIGYFRYGSTPGYPALHVFAGFVLGMLSMYIATRLYGTPHNSSYVIGVLAASILLFTIGYLRYATTPGHPALHVFAGFLFGMLSVHIATRLYGTPQNSWYVIGVLVASILLFTIGYLRYGSTPGHPMLQVFGGLLLGMLSMSIATRLYGTPQNNSHA